MEVHYTEFVFHVECFFAGLGTWINVCLFILLRKIQRFHWILSPASYSLFARISVNGDLNARPFRNAPINSIKTKTNSQKLSLVTNSVNFPLHWPRNKNVFKKYGRMAGVVTGCVTPYIPCHVTRDTDVTPSALCDVDWPISRNPHQISCVTHLVLYLCPGPRSHNSCQSGSSGSWTL